MPQSELTGVMRIHLDELRTSACCLVAQHRDELRPRSIVDILGQGASSQAFHIQFFDDDSVVVSYQPRTSLMEVIGACSGRSRVATSHHHACFASPTRASRLARKGALPHSQASLGSSRRFQARDESAIGKSGEGRNAEVDANRAIQGAKSNLMPFHVQADGPTLHIPSEDARLDGAVFRYRPVQIDAQSARHALEADAAIVEADAAKFMETEGIEPSHATKTRKPRLGTRFDPPKEGLVGIIKSFQRPTLQANRHCGRFKVALAPLGEAATLVDVRAREAHLAIRIDALLQGSVVELPLAL